MRDLLIWMGHSSFRPLGDLIIESRLAATRAEAPHAKLELGGPRPNTGHAKRGPLIRGPSLEVLRSEERGAGKGTARFPCFKL